MVNDSNLLKMTLIWIAVHDVVELGGSTEKSTEQNWNKNT